MARLQDKKPIRTAFRWQLLVTTAFAVIAGYLAGPHGVLSAALGGAVSIVAGWVFIWVASRGKSKSAEATLLHGLRAEAAKIGTIVVLLWIVFATYDNLVALAFMSAFAVTVVIFSMAFFLRDA